MGYTMLKNIKLNDKSVDDYTLFGATLSFIRNSCEGLRFDKSKAGDDLEGKSLKPNQIPYNMEKDIDRLCFENTLSRFLKSGRKEDAFDVYFCYLEMFVGDYEKTRRMIELLSEFEANGSGLLMKHRDHYSHSVYVFSLGLAIFESNSIFRNAYKDYYKISDEHEAVHHFLEYWGLTALFHDIGYPFELPFEQVCSYFEVGGSKRSERPFVAYQDLEKFIEINEDVKNKLYKIFPDKKFTNTNELFACILAEKLGAVYDKTVTEEKMIEVLTDKPTKPCKFNYFMDHAYFSATVLFKKLFEEMQLDMKKEHLDALTAILMHNSLYKFSVAKYKSEGNKPFKINIHPLAYILMLSDELQCWDRTAYGRNSKKELHPMGASFDFANNHIKVTYLYDEKEAAKVDNFKDEYIDWLQSGIGDAPKLKAYSSMFIKKDGKSEFQADIESIVDLSDIRLGADTGIAKHIHSDYKGYLSDSNFINLYNFAIILNGRWGKVDEWKKAKAAGHEEKFINDENVKSEFAESFKNLSLEYKLSNINQAKAFAKYLNEIGCFYTDKQVDFDLVNEFSNEELLKIGFLEHMRWLKEHYEMGWTYGNPEKDKRELERKHKDMIPDFNGTEVTEEDAGENYKRLDKAEQDKDTEPMECMLAMIRMFDGLRIYRL